VALYRDVLNRGLAVICLGISISFSMSFATKHDLCPLRSASSLEN
jgi:hypothetical protein